MTMISQQAALYEVAIHAIFAADEPGVLAAATRSAIEAGVSREAVQALIRQARRRGSDDLSPGDAQRIANALLPA